MAELVLTNCKLWYGGYDMSGNMNALALNTGAEILDKTAFGATARARIAGLKTTEMQHEGFFSAEVGGPDEELFNAVGSTALPMSAAPDAGADGDIAYMTNVVSGQYTPGAAVGEVMAFSISAEVASDNLAKGTVMHNATRTAAGSGTARQLGAVSATQKMQAAIHVTAINGGTLTVLIKSDDNSGMTSAVTQHTFTAVTAVGGEWIIPIDGAITDDYWQITWTYAGTSVDFVVVLGII